MDTVIESALATAQHQTRARLYAQPDILARGKFSKSHLYNLMARGHFPKPCLRMGLRFTRWAAADVDIWFQAPAAWIAANAEGPSA